MKKLTKKQSILLERVVKDWDNQATALMGDWVLPHFKDSQINNMKVDITRFKRGETEFLSVIVIDRKKNKYVESIVELRKKDSLDSVLSLLSREVTKLVKKVTLDK